MQTHLVNNDGEHHRKIENESHQDKEKKEAEYIQMWRWTVAHVAMVTRLGLENNNKWKQKHQKQDKKAHQI